MMGMVFTAFMDMMDEGFGMTVAEEVLARCPLRSGGAYTAVGTYDREELTLLLEALHQVTGRPAPDLLRAFGGFLFRRLRASHPWVLEEADTLFLMLEQVDERIRQEVEKLYERAEPPAIRTRRLEDGRLEVSYRGGLADMAEGLILACAEHYGQPIRLQRSVDGDRALFLLALEGS